MTAITFDTHKFVRKLESVGFTTDQSEAVADAFRDASGEAELATKRDIDLLRAELRELKAELSGEMKLNRWMLGAVIVAEVVPFLAKLFHG